MMFILFRCIDMPHFILSIPFVTHHLLVRFKEGLVDA